MKQLFAEKEAALQDEMRQRLADRDAEIRRMLAAQTASEEVESASRAAVAEAEAGRRAAEDGLKALRATHESATAKLREAEAEAAAGRERVAQVEGEMRLVLKAMDREKAAAARSMGQLSRMCDEWRTAVGTAQ